MPLLHTSPRPTSILSIEEPDAFRTQGRVRPTPEDLLRDMAFVLQAVRTVRQAMEETKIASYHA